jgi:KDO2-lipid IV(A) lauroyltransferase
MRAADLLVDLGFAAGWRLVRSVPERAAAAAFRAGADLATRRNGPGVRRLRTNLARVLAAAPAEQLDTAVRDGMRSYARYWCEAFRLPTMDPVEVHDRQASTVQHLHHLDDALRLGRGVVVALPHSGNWDVAGVWMIEHLRRLGRPAAMTTVVERLRPDALFRRFLAYRESLGFEVVPAGDGGTATLRALSRRLRDGGVVALVADRDLGGHGVPVDFFGEPARMPAGPAQLAASTGAALVATHCWFTPDGWGLRFGPPVPVARRSDVPGAVQALADRFATGIAEHPADWHMLQRLWLADLPAERRAALT